MSVAFDTLLLWTPPHSWALALFRQGDYEAAGVPMMPAVIGEKGTKRLILIYTIAMILSTLAMVPFGVSGALFLVGAIILGLEFWRRSWLLWRESGTEGAKPLFVYSIFYLFMIFLILFVDQSIFYPVQF